MNTWQEIRDHSFIQNHSRPFRFTAPWRCFFSSGHLTHVLQGSGQRTVHSRGLVLCSVTHFCVVFEVCVWIIVRLEDPNMAHYKISNRVSHFFYLLIFDIIHDAMCLNKMSSTSSRNIVPQHQKCMTFLDEQGSYFFETLPNNMRWCTCRCCFTIVLKVFWPRDSTIFCSSPACRVFSHSNSPPHGALGRYRHTSSSGQFRNILCWLEILNYCPDGGNGNVHCSSSFLKATSLICEAQLYFDAHQKYILCFFSLWWMIKGICALFSLLFIFLWNRKSWLDNLMFIITLECSKLWIWMGIYFRDILS